MLREVFPQTAPKTKAALDLHLSEWDLVLLEVGAEDFEAAMRQHIRNAKFFPTVAELRECAGMGHDLRSVLEAEQAWRIVERDLARRGQDAPPGLSDRIEYAIRAAGGRRAINASFSDSVTTEQFTKKAFVEAFTNYQAAARLGLHQLDPSVQQLLTAAADQRPQLRLVSGSKQSTPTPAWKPPAKAMPRPLSDEQYEARKVELEKQKQELRTKFGF